MPSEKIVDSGGSEGVVFQRRRNNMSYGGVIVKECEGCRKIEKHFDWLWCSIYRYPAIWWKRGGCPFNTKAEVKPNRKVRVGQQKQRKRR